MKDATAEGTSKTDVVPVMLKRRAEIITAIDRLRDELAAIDETLNKLAGASKYYLLERVLLESPRPLYFREILAKMEEAGYRPGNRDRRGSVSYMLYGRQRAKYVRKTSFQDRPAFWHANYLRGESAPLINVGSH